MIGPLLHEVNPMPDSMRRTYELPAKILEPFDPVLLTARDKMFEQHLPLPLTF
jgi:hypothetical protein